MNAVYQDLGPCRCESGHCDAVGTKLNKAGHVARLCTCFECQGRRNQKKGRSNQTQGHRALGGIGISPKDEETRGGYDIRVQVEHKKGYKGATSMLYRFLATEFFRRALSQASKAQRIGDGSMPAVMFDGRWLLVDCRSIGPEPQIVSPTRSEG